MKNFMQPRSGVLRENHSDNPSPSFGKQRQSPSTRRQKSTKENAPPSDLNSGLDPSPSTGGKHPPSSNGKLRSPLPPRPPSSRSNPLKRKFAVEAAAESGAGPSDSGVKVIIRMRPPNKDRDEGETIVHKLSNDTLSILGQNFTFDSVADMDATQQDIFQLIGAPLVEHCLSGFNSSVFAYGQTGSGKTYTMWGPANALLEGNKLNDQHGLTPRVLERLFAQINEEQIKHTSKQLKYQCRCSFLEIYNEQITDLLDPSQKNLQIREDVNCGVYVENLTEECVCNMKDVSQILLKGLSNRRTGSTSINSDSSRSHSVFTCVVESRFKSMADGLSTCRTSRINLVDLAGSERQKITGAAGERLKEAGNINRSLSQLGNLINILAEVSQSGKQRHIPYRDSRLTFLLQESLGGNAKLSMVCAISPGQCCKNETFSTLRFAQRAKAIKNKAVVNEVMQDDVNVLREVIRQLKDELLRMKGNNTQSNSNEGYSTGWNARRSLNLLKFSLNHPTTLPRVDDDSDEEMEIDEDAVEKLPTLPTLNPESAQSSLASVSQEPEKDSQDVKMDEEEECSVPDGKEENAHHDFEEGLQVTPVKSQSESVVVSDLSIIGSKNGVLVPSIDITPHHEVSPILKSPTPSVSPRITDSHRKSLRGSELLNVSQTENGVLFPEGGLHLGRPAKRHSVEANQRSRSHERLAASLHRGLEIIETCRQSSVLRRSSFRFPVMPAELKPVLPVKKVEVGVQTLSPDDTFSKDTAAVCNNETLSEDAADVVCVKCKDSAFSAGQDASNISNMQLIPLDGSHSRGKSKKKVNKAVEKVLTGSIRRELQLEEICVKQNSEIAQLNRLVQQYKHERECNAIIGQLREDKILRLESLMDGVLPAEEFLGEELLSLKSEHNLLKQKYDNHPEVSRAQIELTRVQQELDRYKSFVEFGEREVLIEEIQDLRNQLMYHIDTDQPHPSPNEKACLDMEEKPADMESKWASITEELRTELETSRCASENLNQELASERKSSQELKEAMQLAMEAHARVLEQYAELEEKHMQLLARNRKIQEGIGDVKKAAAKAGVKGTESKFINALAAEISVLRVEHEKERRYFRDEKRGLQAQVRDTAEAVQAAGELLVRLKEAEEAAAAAERRTAMAEVEAENTCSRIEMLKRKHEMEISSLNQRLEESRLGKVIMPVYNSENDRRWTEEFEPFYSGESAGYDQCNV